MCYQVRPNPSCRNSDYYGNEDTSALLLIPSSGLPDSMFIRYDSTVSEQERNTYAILEQ